MDVIEKDNESSVTVKTSATNDSDEIWEIIDKEDDGSIFHYRLLTNVFFTNMFLFHRGPKKFVSSSLCIYTISHRHTTMVAYDRSAKASITILTDLRIK
jgi:hypothetical protein